MLVLDQVTLCCIDTANRQLALRALERSRAGIRFNRTMLLTHTGNGIDAPNGIDVVSIEPLASRDDYSRFVLKSLLPHITTTHVLLVQWDGYVWNPDAWDESFLDCDYIGAKWFWHDEGLRVGNGGFSLRSRRLLTALQDPRITLDEVEDKTICRTFRPLLERDFGIRFADEATADRFAFEAAHPIGRPFGFHGLFNFCRVVPAGELALLAPGFSDAIAQSPQLAQLLRNCMALGLWLAASAIAQRILAVQPANDEARAMLVQAEANKAQAPAAARNEPCPCGSGKRYKHCHGAIGVDRKRLPDTGVDAQSIQAIAAQTEQAHQQDHSSTAGARAADMIGATAMPAYQQDDGSGAGPRGADKMVAQAIETHRLGDLAAAERGYRAALAVAPDHAYALHYLGVTLYQKGRFHEALPLLEDAAQRVPQEPEFHNNLGLVLAAIDRTGDAIAAYRRTLARKPDHALAWSNLGLALQAANELPEAIDAFRQALCHAPEFAQAHWNLGLALLAHGEFAEGWREYEWRLQIDELGRQGGSHTGKRWAGDDPRGKTILLTREQGFGDTVQFARFAPLLAQKGARVLMEACAPLVPLLARASGVAGAYAPGDPLPAYDVHLPLLSVAGLLGITAASIPCQVPYLSGNDEHAAALLPLLDPYRATLMVGLSWAGARNHANDRRRSCPLATMAPLLEMPGVTFFSLQKGDGEEEIATVPAAGALIQLEARNDFDHKAALLSLLDLVISVDTANAHLAGALGRPLWLLLPFAADWRWHVARNDSPWYPTARLFRQPRIGDWNSVIDDVRRALAAKLADRQ